jgi:hypothetical protein
MYHDRVKMSESKFPARWDAARVQRLIEHYEMLSEEEQVAEDEVAAQPQNGQTVITVPDELLPAIRKLLGGRGAPKKVKKKARPAGKGKGMGRRTKPRKP